MGKHEAPGKSDEWYTPPHVFQAMGELFDVDVASPGADIVPWIPANKHITTASLEIDWIREGKFIWMNPPFGGRNGLVPWLRKFAEHANGICLVPDRTSAPWWQTFSAKATCILFVAPKLRFIDKHGNEGTSPPQGTSLFGIGARASGALRTASRRGLGRLMQPVTP